jgi:hypothetical protein
MHQHFKALASEEKSTEKNMNPYQPNLCVGFMQEGENPLA